MHNWLLWLQFLPMAVECLTNICKPWIERLQKPWQLFFSRLFKISLSQYHDPFISDLGKCGTVLGVWHEARHTLKMTGHYKQYLVSQQVVSKSSHFIASSVPLQVQSAAMLIVSDFMLCPACYQDIRLVFLVYKKFIKSISKPYK